jgi:peptidoglycan/LPS O-acetylase OafA/YrhL
MPVIFLGQQLLNNKLRNSVQSGISIFLSCSILTLVLSDLSYRFFEKKFLILKEKYSPIISRV